MHILFDARVIQDHFPGIGRYAYNLLQALPSQLGPADRLLAWRDTQTRNTRFDWQPLSGRGIQFVDRSMPFFGPRNLLGRPPVSAGVFHYPYYMRPLRGGRRSITTIHDVIALLYPQGVPSAQARISIRLFNGMAIWASNCVITISHQAAEDLARFFPSSRGKTVIIHEAPDPIFTPQSSQQVEAVRARYNLPPSFALFLASNKPHKNLVRLIEAWKMVIGDWRLEIGDFNATPSSTTGERLPQSPTSNFQSPILVIAGHQDPRYTQARQQVNALGLGNYVQFIGEVPNEDLPSLYSACDLFIFPSLYEGFGLPPLEAMASGAPVACSNASSLPEVVGNAAVLFDPSRPEEIAAACRRVLSDPALQADIRAHGRAQAARFTWEEAARKTVEVYHSVLRQAA
jgi:alpha-1,3-rhamnosyl/mannosyltransferase